jgi:hypothetical protein
LFKPHPGLLRKRKRLIWHMAKLVDQDRVIIDY